MAIDEYTKNLTRDQLDKITANFAAGKRINLYNMAYSPRHESLCSGAISEFAMGSWIKLDGNYKDADNQPRNFPFWALGWAIPKVTDHQGNLMYVNPAAYKREEKFGYTTDEERAKYVMQGIFLIGTKVLPLSKRLDDKVSSFFEKELGYRLLYSPEAGYTIGSISTVPIYVSSENQAAAVSK